MYWRSLLMLLWLFVVCDLDCTLWVQGVRPATSLGHQAWRRAFWEGPKFFKLCPIDTKQTLALRQCPIVFNYVQHIFPGGRKVLQVGLRPPTSSWLRSCTVPQFAYWSIGIFLHPCESHFHSILYLDQNYKSPPPTSLTSLSHLCRGDTTASVEAASCLKHTTQCTHFQWRKNFISKPTSLKYY